MNNEEKILEKLDQMGAKVDQMGIRMDRMENRMDQVGKQLDAHGKLLQDHGQKIDRLIDKVVVIEEKLDQKVDKKDFEKFREESLDGQDKLIHMVNKLDQERVFGNERTKRIEDEVERLKQNHPIA